MLGAGGRWGDWRRERGEGRGPRWEGTLEGLRVAGCGLRAAGKTSVKRRARAPASLPGHRRRPPAALTLSPKSPPIQTALTQLCLQICKPRWYVLGCFSPSCYAPQHRAPHPHPTHRFFPAPIPVSRSFKASSSPALCPRRVSVLVARRRPHRQHCILTAKQTRVNKFLSDLLISICKLLPPLLLQNRAKPQRCVVFCDRVTPARPASASRCSPIHCTPPHSPQAPPRPRQPSSCFSRAVLGRSLLLSLFSRHSLHVHTLSESAANPQVQTTHSTTNMAKEKTTRGKGKATKADSGKKKKGENHVFCLSINSF